jgi:hypothetical protein
MKLEPIAKTEVYSTAMAFPILVPLLYKNADYPKDYPSFKIMSFLFAILITILPEFIM